MREKYFLFWNSEDGAQSRSFESAAELSDWLDDNEMHDVEWVGPDHDWETTGNDTVMLVKGDLVAPKPKKVVKSWDFGR